MGPESSGTKSRVAGEPFDGCPCVSSDLSYIGCESGWVGSYPYALQLMLSSLDSF